MCLFKTFRVTPKTGVFYKVFSQKEGKLYPAFKNATIIDQESFDYRSFEINTLYDKDRYHAFMTLDHAKSLTEEALSCYDWNTLFPGIYKPEIWVVKGIIVEIGYLHHGSSRIPDKVACVLENMTIIRKIDESKPETIYDINKSTYGF